MRIGRLQVNRHWIVDSRLDAGILQGSAHPVALRSFNDIAVPYTLGIWKMCGKCVGRICKQLAITCCATGTPGIPSVEMLKFNGEHCRLEAVHPVVIPDLVMQVFLALCVVAQRARTLCDGLIIRD